MPSLLPNSGRTWFVALEVDAEAAAIIVDHCLAQPGGARVARVAVPGGVGRGAVKLLHDEVGRRPVRASDVQLDDIYALIAQRLELGIQGGKYVQR